MVGNLCTGYPHMRYFGSALCVRRSVQAAGLTPSVAILIPLTEEERMLRRHQNVRREGGELRLQLPACHGRSGGPLTHTGGVLVFP